MAAKKGTDLSQYEKFTGWDKLDQTEQTSVVQLSEVLTEKLELKGQTELAIGEYLKKLQAVLLPKRLFVGYLDFKFHMSRATAYRYMGDYETGVKVASQPVIAAAISRDIPLRAIERMVETTPAPQTNDPVKISEFLTLVEKQPAQPRPAQTDPEILKKEVVNFYRLRFERLELTGRAKTKWIDDTFGMLLTISGLASDKTVSPVAIPEAFTVTHGRPPQQKAA